MKRLQAAVVLSLFLLGVGCGGGSQEAPDGSSAAGSTADDRVSEFGRYEGYSEARFDQWIRTSEYISVRDGTRLAADVVRPAVDGRAVDEALPVIWTHSRYHRTPDALVSLFDPEAGQEDDGTVISYVDADAGLQRLVGHGYVFVGVGVRGSGASYGTYEGLFSPAETRDAHDVIEWIVQQPWSDGNVGMWGGSYLGITQYMAASTGHPALKAIFPTVALFDFYEVAYPGGVFRDDMLEQWGELTENLDRNVPAPPVDADADASERDAAVAEHADNWDVTEEIAAAPYRDHDSESFAWSRHSPARFLDEIDASGVAAYHFGGWYDVFALDEILWFVNYEGPDKLAMGPWSHTAQGEAWQQERGRLEAVEQHRWFDRWLKGVDNGVMDGPPIHYATIDDAETWTWKSAPHWPPPDTSVVTFHFAGGLTGSVGSVNDGLLTREEPAEAGFDEYEVDSTTTTGTATRWDNAVGQGPMSYPDMTATDALSLTYTTPPLQVDVTLTGHPVVTLWATSSTGDADFHVLLEEVDATGVSHYVTEGVLRASHRATSTPPWDNLALPFQRSASGDPEPLPALDGQPAEVVMDLIPTSRRFNAGHRIRLTIMGADADNTRPVEATESPTIRLYRGGDHLSRVELRVESDTAP